MLDIVKSHKSRLTLQSNYMKYLATICLLALSAVATAQSPDIAQRRDASAGLFVASIRDGVRDITITNHEGAALAGRQAAQLDNGTMIIKGWAIIVDQKDAHEKDRQAEIAYAGQVNPQIEHEASICHGELPQGTYNWCQNEIARLTPLANAVNNWNAKIATRADEINSNIAQMNEVTKAYNAKGVALYEEGENYIAKYNLILARINAFKERLTGLQNDFDICKSVQDPNASLEYIHETCGSVFDGNVVQTATTNYPVPDYTFHRYDAAPICAKPGVCLEKVQ